jgi:DNA-binding CsgD family transcriptional regulator/PAS domain-containing protein
MDLSPSRFDRLVNLTYDTLEDKRAWRSVLECLNEAMDTRAVHLLAFDSRHGTLSYSDGADMAPQIDMEYIQRYQYIDPRVGLMRAKPHDEWMHCHEHFDDEFVAVDPFYQEFLLPHGARYLSACKLIEDANATVLLAFLRRPQDGPLPAEAIFFLDRMRPHLQRACRIGLSHFVYSAQALVGHTLVDKLSQPVMLLSTAGEIVLANAAARRLVESTSLIGIANGRLVLPEPYRAPFFARCAELENETRFAPAGPAEHEFSSLHLSSGDGERPDTLYGFFASLLPERVMGSFGLRPLVMLFLYHPDSAQEIDSSLLNAAFGLSHAECRIASMLADGIQLKTIADTLGVQYDTVRKQLMSIYQKTSTNRQADLVRLLLHLPAAPRAKKNGARIRATDA